MARERINHARGDWRLLERDEIDDAEAVANIFGRSHSALHQGEITMRTGKFGWILGAAVLAMTCHAQTQVSVNVDLAKSEGPYKPIYSWFGFDESNYGAMKYGRQLMKELHDLSPVPVYIRAHHLLTSGNGVPELKWSSSNVFSLGANGKPVYSVTITDETFDAYKEAGVRPMVELGFMPKDLAATVPGI